MESQPAIHEFPDSAGPGTMDGTDSERILSLLREGFAGISSGCGDQTAPRTIFYVNPIPEELWPRKGAPDCCII